MLNMFRSPPRRSSDALKFKVHVPPLTNLQAYMDIDADDNYQLSAYEYLKKCAVDGASYIEFTIPLHCIHEVANAINQANAEFDIESRVIIGLPCDKGIDRCEFIFNNLLNNRHPYIVGIAFISHQIDFDPRPFESLSQQAHAKELKVVLDCENPIAPESILQALNAIKPDRARFNITSMESSVLDKLAEKNIALALSVDTLLCIPSLLHGSIGISLNTTELTSSGGFKLSTEYDHAKIKLKLQPAQMHQLYRNGINTSFAPTALKEKLLARLELYIAYQAIIAPRNRWSQAIFTAIQRYVQDPTLNNTETLYTTVGDHPIFKPSCLHLLQCHRTYLQACLPELDLALEPEPEPEPLQDCSTDISDEEMALVYERNRLSRRRAGHFR